MDISLPSSHLLLLSILSLLHPINSSSLHERLHQQTQCRHVLDSDLLVSSGKVSRWCSRGASRRGEVVGLKLSGFGLWVGEERKERDEEG